MSLPAIRITLEKPLQIRMVWTLSFAAFLHLCYAEAGQEASYSSEGFARLTANAPSGSLVLPR